MLIKDWMTKEVIFATPETSVVKATKLMKDNNIKQLPIVDDQMHVVGIISDRDVKSATPSTATTLDARELLYLLSELKLKSIMTIDPLCVGPNDSIEKAALIMEEKDYGGFPVTENDKLVGIISGHDIFKVLISLMGARQAGILLAFELPDKVGTLRPVLTTLANQGANILSILSDHEHHNDARRIFIRIRPLASKEKEEMLITLLEQEHSLLYYNKISAS